MKSRMYKYLICLIPCCAFFSCQSEAQSNELLNEEIIKTESPVDTSKYSYTITNENRDENYILEIGVKNESISSAGEHTIDLSDANKLSLTCSRLADSSASKPSIHGIISVFYKEKDITESVRGMMSRYREGFTLTRSPEYEKLGNPIIVTLEKGYVLFVHREIILDYQQTHE
jgi:hypothetical protein